MKKFKTFFLITLFLFLSGCTNKNNLEDDGKINTPTNPPNQQPYCIFYNDQLYQYESDFVFTEENYNKLFILGEITDSVNSDQLPTSNFEINMNCYLPTPIFGFTDNSSKIVMEVNWIFPSTLTHQYLVFTVEDSN